MSFVKIWVHVVFATKNRQPLLHRELRHALQRHIIQNCADKAIHLQSINGFTDHLHCLIALGKDQNIAKIVQLIKGESSFWINKHKLTLERFEWQDDYFAVSVSESLADSVTRYIKNQEEHHTSKTFNQEVQEFMQKYGWANTLDQ